MFLVTTLVSPDKIMTYRYPASLNIPEKEVVVTLWFALFTNVDLAF